ncbi:MAG TPA: hypothetical protein DD640_05675 [Clostridiales bacterium]|nr:hypothetical protein [Clostridiales bacterium]
MKLKIVRADPAGNITLLVTGKVPPEQYGSTAKKLLELTSLGGEQVGFITTPVRGGAIRLQMMGGEFCGNALRSAGYYCAAVQGICGQADIPVEISGCDRSLMVSVDTRKNEARAEMPLPLGIGRVSVNGLELDTVVFNGIVHAIMPGTEPDAELARTIAASLLQKYPVAAAGALFIDLPNLMMQPAVYVRDTDTLVFENSCASGSSAVAALLSRDRPNGQYDYEICQLGGLIRATAVTADGRLQSLYAGGRIELSAEIEIEI